MKIKLSLRIVYAVLFLVFVLIFAVAAGMAYYTPYSGRAYVEYGMAPVFSKVGGNIEEIYCRNGETVRKGDPLFHLDARNYEAEVQRLEALYDTTVSKLSSLDAQMGEVAENIRKQEKTLEKYRIDYERDRKLMDRNAVAVRTFEDSRLKYDTALSELAALNRHLEALKSDRGATGDSNSELRRLRAELQVARNQLDDTVIRAPISGTVSCHQLYHGQMIRTDEKYAVIQESGRFSVYVDVMEKGVARLRADQEALVTFDALPGRVFHGKLKGVVRELRSGYVAPQELHQIEEDTRWIRTVGRTRIEVNLSEDVPDEMVLTTGSKAAVAFMAAGHPVYNFLTRSWVGTVSVCNFIH